MELPPPLQAHLDASHKAYGREKKRICREKAVLAREDWEESLRQKLAEGMTESQAILATQDDLQDWLGKYLEEQRQEISDQTHRLVIRNYHLFAAARRA